MSLRPASAPSSRSSLRASFGAGPASNAFIHRDIFATPTLTPGGPPIGEAGLSSPPIAEPAQQPAAASSAAAAASSTPRHRKQESSGSSSILPSESKLERWDHKLQSYPLLGWLESRTGIRKVYLASAILLLVCLLVFRGTGLSAVSVCVGFLYPLHMSLKTIENCTSLFAEISGENRFKHTEEEYNQKRGEILGQLRQWLIYWLVYGLFNLFESLSDFSLSWLPVYHPLKLLFLLWCFLPQYQGSQLVFDILVRPVLIRHESAIESGVETASQAAIASVKRVGRVVRANSIQLTKAIQKTGEQLLATQSLGVSSSSSSSSGLGVVRSKVAAIESMSSMSVSSNAAVATEPGQSRLHGIVEGQEGEHILSDESQSFAAFAAASRIAAQHQQNR